MTNWDELQPEFRRAVLRERREGRTMEQVADELHMARRTVYRLVENQVQPSRAVRYLAEQFVCHVARSNEGEAGG